VCDNVSLFLLFHLAFKSQYIICYNVNPLKCFEICYDRLYVYINLLQNASGLKNQLFIHCMYLIHFCVIMKTLMFDCAQMQRGLLPTVYFILWLRLLFPSSHYLHINFQNQHALEEKNEWFLVLFHIWISVSMRWGSVNCSWISGNEKICSSPCDFF
jgi:hypothetical protein